MRNIKKICSKQRIKKDSYNGVSNKNNYNYKYSSEKDLTKQIYEENGITIMSLVVTIIVLIILAGITIQMSLDDNGIIKQAQRAKNTYESSRDEEQSALGDASKAIQDAMNSSGGSSGSTGGGSSSGGSSGSDDDDLKQQLEDLKNENDKLKQDNEDLKNENDDLKDQNDELQKENNDLKSKQATGNATPEQVLSGATFSTASKIGQTGSMVNRDGKTTAWSGYETISVEPHPQDNSQGLVTISNQYGNTGFFGKNSKITGNIANLNAGNIKAGVNVGRFDGKSGIVGTFTSDGTATADNISNGKVAYVNGQRIVGNGAAESNSYNSGYSNGKSAGSITSIQGVGSANQNISTIPGELYICFGLGNNVNGNIIWSISGASSLWGTGGNSGGQQARVNLVRATGTSMYVSCGNHVASSVVRLVHN